MVCPGKEDRSGAELFSRMVRLIRFSGYINILFILITTYLKIVKIRLGVGLLFMSAIATDLNCCLVADIVEVAVAGRQR
jgi:hypothetical protein